MSKSQIKRVLDYQRFEREAFRNEVKAMVVAYDQAVADNDRLRAEVEALKATCKQHLQVQRYELVYDEMQEDDDGDWVRWIDIEFALRGEGEK